MTLGMPTYCGMVASGNWCAGGLELALNINIWFISSANCNHMCGTYVCFSFSVVVALPTQLCTVWLYAFNFARCGVVEFANSDHAAPLRPARLQSRQRASSELAKQS
jgi:hypothetical protein